MDQFNLLQKIILWGIPLLFAVTLHEAAHGWVASRLGDQTARLLGRITLNPIKHIDLVGTLIVPALLIYLGGFIFGWAKPVPINCNNLRSPKRDMAFVALAGPFSNFLMAIFWAATAKLGFYLGVAYKIEPAFALYFMGTLGIYLNILVGLLNLIPLPPLDGSRVLSSFLPPQLAYFYARIEPYGFFILFGLLTLGVLNKILLPLVSNVVPLIYLVFQLPVL